MLLHFKLLFYILKYLKKENWWIFYQMNAFDVMSVDIVAAKDNATVIEISTRLVLGVFNGMPIIDDNGSVIGIITAIDILWAIRYRKDLNTLLVRDLMTQNPSVVNQNTKYRI